MSRAVVNGIVVGYDDLGPYERSSAGPDPLVLIHGHPFNRSMWRGQVERFGRDRRVIAPDLRGYGDTTTVPGKTPLETFARDIAALLDHLGIEKFVLGGLSMGGQIVLECYRLFPERIVGLVLADTFAQEETPAGKEHRTAVADRLLTDGMDAYAEEVLPKMLAPASIRALPAIAAQVLDMMRATPPEGAAAALRGRAERPDYVDLLATVSVPTLVVVGADDEYTPVRDAEFLHERIAGSRLAVIDGAGHLPNLERETEFDTALAGFLESVPEAANRER